MKWTDVGEIAIALADTHPQVDPKTIRFTDLHRWVMSLPGFADNPERAGERVLEAIQQAWIDEVE
ncbi:MAG: Fe-S cluster assembly protein IscX [Burkholderiaceae bacterium]|nr:Fe-S cluster assembly protein IscX [Burkholderiaceae bacterium]